MVERGKWRSKPSPSDISASINNMMMKLVPTKLAKRMLLIKRNETWHYPWNVTYTPNTILKYSHKIKLTVTSINVNCQVIPQKKFQLYVMSKTVKYWSSLSENWLKDGINYSKNESYTCADINSDFRVRSAKIIAWKYYLQGQNLMRKFPAVWRYQKFFFRKGAGLLTRLR